MKIGFRCNYERDDATLVCLQVAKIAMANGFDVEIFPYEKPGQLDPMWDRHVIRNPKQSYETWLEGLSQLYFVKPPSLHEVRFVKSKRVSVCLIALWDVIEVADEEVLPEFDAVITPSTAVAKHLKKRLGLKNLHINPWDPGIPITFEPRPVDNNRIGVLWPLENGQATRQECEFIKVVDQLLEMCKNAWVTVTFSDLPASDVRELRKLAQLADGRVELLKGTTEAKQELLFGYHDLTVWPTLFEGVGVTGLTSIYMGTPVVAFDYPLTSDFLKDGKNACLVPCELNFNPFGVPRVLPDYRAFGRYLIDLVNSPARIAHMRDNAVLGLRERRDSFLTVWQTILNDFTPRKKRND